MRNRMAIVLVGVVSIASVGPVDRLSAQAVDRSSAVSRWAGAFEKFDQQDRADPPEPGGILFVGSSSIRMWDVARTLPDYQIRNRGFGGSQMSDVLENFDRLVLRYRPRLVVLYEGDNDVAAGESAEQIAGEFRELAERLHATIPEATLCFVSIKPSIARWNLYATIKTANDSIQAYCQQQDYCQFIDVSKVMLDDSGEPDPNLFIADGLHLNETGYRRWSDLVRPYLDAVNPR